MLSEDPLTNIEFLSKIDSLRTNRCGRPRSSDTILFCPQPASIISTQIREEMKLHLDSNIMSEHDIKCEEVSPISQSDNESDILDNYISSVDQTNSQNSFKKPKSEESLLKQRLLDKYANQEDYKSNTENYGNCESRNQTNNLPLENGMTKFICDFEGCTYSTNISTNLTKHKRKHTKEKPYICDSCTFRSNFASSLKAHRRIHTNERPYQCEYCVYSCNSSSNLKKHAYHRHKIWHKREPTEPDCEAKLK